MANERSAQVRLEQVNTAIEKSYVVRNFEGTLNLDRQLNGLVELPISEHLERLVQIGEKRRSIRTAIDEKAVPKLHERKIQVENEISTEIAEKPEVKPESVLPEPFDPENPRGLTIEEAAVLVGLFTTREPYLSSIGVTPLSDETSRAILGKLEVPLSQSDVQHLRSEVFNGLAESVRIGTIDAVLDNTKDNDIRTLLTYVSVFQIDAADEELAQFLEDKSLDFDLRRGEVLNVRYHTTGSSQTARQPTQVDSRFGGDSGIIPTVSEPAIPGISQEDYEMVGPGYDEPSELSFNLFRDEIAVEVSEPSEAELSTFQDSDELPISDEEFETWYREEEERERELLSVEAESHIADKEEQKELKVNGREVLFESRALEVIRKVLEAELSDQFNVSAMERIHGKKVFRAVERALEHGLISKVMKTGASSGQKMYGKEEYAVLVYLMSYREGVTRKQARKLSDLTKAEIELRKQQGQNGGK